MQCACDVLWAVISAFGNGLRETITYRHNVVGERHNLEAHTVLDVTITHESDS